MSTIDFEIDAIRTTRVVLKHTLPANAKTVADVWAALDAAVKSLETERDADDFANQTEERS